MNEIPQETRVAVEKALRANPMHSDIMISEELEVSPTCVKYWRLKLGLWTSRRIRYRHGKPEVYHIPRPNGLTDEQCLDSDDAPLEVSDKMLCKLHSLASVPDGQEAFQLIRDILEISTSVGSSGVP